MPVIRVAAMAALAAGVALAVGTALDTNATLTIDAWALAVMLLIIAVNAVAVFALTRRETIRTRTESIGAWLVMAGVWCCLVAMSSHLWVYLLVPGASFPVALLQLEIAAYGTLVFATMALAALIAGWSLWRLPRLLARWHAV